MVYNKIPLLWRGGFDRREKTGWSHTIDHPAKNYPNFRPPSKGGEFFRISLPYIFQIEYL